MERNTEKEFEYAYTEYSEALFRFCYFRISDKNRAKEIMQDAYTQTWQYIVKGNYIENLRACLYKVARNLLINEKTRRKEISSLETMNEDTGFELIETDSDNTEEKSEGRRIMDFLKELDHESREILTMRYVDDMSLKEIASVIGINPNYATVKLHRATKKLKQMYNIENKYEKP